MEDQLMKEMLDQAPDAVIFADMSGRIAYWNTAAERVFGHSAKEVQGERLDLIIPEAQREAHWRGFDRALAAGETKYWGKALPTRAVRAGGEAIYVELSFAIVKSGDEVVGALAFARDITERWTQDREMRRRLRELEATQPAH